MADSQMEPAKRNVLVNRDGGNLIERLKDATR